MKNEYDIIVIGRGPSGITAAITDAKSAGVPYTKGCEPDGLMQPMSLEFAVGGVDESTAVYPTFGTHPEIEEKMRRFVETGRFRRLRIFFGGAFRFAMSI